MHSSRRQGALMGCFQRVESLDQHLAGLRVHREDFWRRCANTLSQNPLPKPSYDTADAPLNTAVTRASPHKLLADRRQPSPSSIAAATMPETRIPRRCAMSTRKKQLPPYTRVGPTSIGGGDVKAALGRSHSVSPASVLPSIRKRSQSIKSVRAAESQSRPIASSRLAASARPAASSRKVLEPDDVAQEKPPGLSAFAPSPKRSVRGLPPPGTRASVASTSGSVRQKARTLDLRAVSAGRSPESKGRMTKGVSVRSSLRQKTKSLESEARAIQAVVAREDMLERLNLVCSKFQEAADWQDGFVALNSPLMALFQAMVAKARLRTLDAIECVSAWERREGGGQAFVYRNKPYLVSMGPQMRFLDKYGFVMKLTKGVSCMHDVLLCCLTATGLPLQPCSNTELREGGHIDSFALRLRMALKTLYSAQQRSSSPSLHLLPSLVQGKMTCAALGSEGCEQMPSSKEVMQGPQESWADRSGGSDAEAAWADDEKIAQLLSQAVAENAVEMAQKHRVHLDADALTASEQSVGLSTGKCGSQKQTVHLVLSVQELVSVSFKLREQNLEKSDCQTHGNLQLQTNGVVVAVDEILQDILEFVAEDELKTSKHNEASASPVVVEHLGTPGGTLTCSAADSKIDNAETHDDAVQVTMTVVQGVVVRLEVDIGGSMHDCFPEMSEAPSDRSQATVAVVDHLVEELAVTPCMHVHAKVSPDDNDVAAVDEVLGDLLDAVDVLEV